MQRYATPDADNQMIKREKKYLLWAEVNIPFVEHLESLGSLGCKGCAACEALEHNNHVHWGTA